MTEYEVELNIIDGIVYDMSKGVFQVSWPLPVFFCGWVVAARQP